MNNNDVGDTDIICQEAIDIISVMQQQERSIYHRIDYLRSQTDNGIHKYGKIVDGAWRQRIIEWMFGVVDHCSLRRDSVAVAAHYLDMAVVSDIVVSREEFQLAAMTSLQLAIKLYDSTVVNLRSMTKLGRGVFSEQDVIAMEFKILQALQWHVHPPTPSCFLRQLLRMLPSSLSPIARYMITEVTRFVSEISVCLYKFVSYPPSAVAYAGIVLATERIDPNILPIWQQEQVKQTFATYVDLHDDSELIREIVKKLQESFDSSLSLRDLIDTIDRHCRGHSIYTTLSVSNSDMTYQSCASAPPTVMRSPRDVTEFH
jgi:Cyclin, N-terminal domain/Cyclin, C-terminal domain